MSRPVGLHQISAMEVAAPTFAQLAGYDGVSLFTSIRLLYCDGRGLKPSSEYMAEAHERELPGKGDFPRKEILSALPESTPLEVEVPSARRGEAGGSALTRAQIAHGGREMSGL
jgi:hypothetical protein